MKQRLSGLDAWLRERWLEAILIVGLVGVFAWFGTVAYSFVPKPPPPPQFEGRTAYHHVLMQTQIGPRPTGTEAGAKAGDYIIEKLRDQGWQVEVQPFTYRGVQGRNIIGKAGSGPVIIVGAHYDTRRRADNDPLRTKRTEPVLGANDGASGVGVLLELAR